MVEQLEVVYERFERVEKQLSDPEVFADMKRFATLNKEFKDLQKIVEAGKKYQKLLADIEESRQIVYQENDAELVDFAKQQLEELLAIQEPMTEKLKLMLVPKEPEDVKNAILEIRAGAGGDEASLFAGDLYRMYMRYCELKGWKVEVMDISEGTVGGYKELILKVTGEEVYGTLKYEAGVHRVQRVPQTESQGRIHTSAASVIVMPEAEEIDIELKDSDIRFDEFCSSGPGGQSVNTTKSAVRLTHLPTGIVAQCQDEKSKLKNYEKALSVLRSRIYEIELQKKLEKDAAKRKTMVSSSDRSAKIRTYNFPQSRVTDHRIGLTLYNLDYVLNGDLAEFIESLKIADNTERLKEQGLIEA